MFVLFFCLQIQIKIVYLIMIFEVCDSSVYLLMIVTLTTGEVLLFYKYYDPTVQKISYVGYSYESITRFFGKSLSELYKSSVGIFVTV